MIEGVFVNADFCSFDASNCIIESLGLNQQPLYRETDLYRGHCVYIWQISAEISKQG